MLEKLHPEVLKFFEAYSTIITINNRETFMYYPFWIKTTLRRFGGKDVEIVSFEKLPEEVLEMIKNMRDEKPS